MTTTFLPVTPAVPVVRTDFSDPAAWDEVQSGITWVSPDGFEADVTFVDDPAFAGLTADELLDRLPGDCEHVLLLVVDETAISSPEHPVLVVDLEETAGPGVRVFRAVPHTVQDFEANLRIANVDWEDYADSVDDDGVLRSHLVYGRLEDLPE
ncbi:MAG: hypothetical protein LBV34_25615 [Nocardiopsaceae bacterium]|jgi:hypothetical protein|nr:hypothetical protein [Nocardiopsaceae bacterium]